MPSDFDKKHAPDIRAHMEKILAARKLKSAKKMADHNFKADMHNWNERKKRLFKNIDKK
jgi:hypothetical protein